MASKVPSGSCVNQRSMTPGGAVRASSAVKRPSRARSTMRPSMSVPVIETRAPRDGARRRPRPACRPRRRTSSRRSRRGCGRPGASSGRIVRSSTVHCSGLRQSCETLIVTRSRNSSTSVLVALEHAQVLGQLGQPARVGERADAALHLPALVLQQVDACRGGGRPRRSRRSRRRCVGKALMRRPPGRSRRAGRRARRTTSARPASATARGMP